MAITASHQIIIGPVSPFTVAQVLITQLVTMTAHLRKSEYALVGG